MHGALALCRKPSALGAAQLSTEDSQALAASMAEHVHAQDLRERELQACLDLLACLHEVGLAV